MVTSSRCPRTKLMPSRMAAQNGVRTELEYSLTGTPRRIDADISNSAASATRAKRRTGHLDQRARSAGTGDFRRGGRQRVLGMRFDQPFARHDLGKHDLRGAAGRRVDGANQETNHIEPAHRQPSKPPCHGDGGDGARDRQLADHIHGQFADTIEPYAGRQREQHERDEFHRRQQTHLGRSGMHQHRRRQRQRQQSYLTAEGRYQYRSPQPSVGCVAQQIGGRKSKAIQPPGRQPCAEICWVHDADG